METVVDALIDGMHPNVWCRYHPFVMAVNASNVAITGGGTIDGAGQYWWDRQKMLQYVLFICTLTMTERC